MDSDLKMAAKAVPNPSPGLAELYLNMNEYETESYKAHEKGENRNVEEEYK